MPFYHHKFLILNLHGSVFTMRTMKNLFYGLISVSLCRVCLCRASATFSPPDVPKITDLSFINVTDSTIGLSWSPLNSTAVTGYRITVLAAGDSVPIFVEFVEPTKGFYTVHGLEPGIDYDITVTTVTENGESEPITITQQTGKCVRVCVFDYTICTNFDIKSTLFSLISSSYPLAKTL